MYNILVEIPTKNRDRVLGKCLAALLLQDYQNFDILILNDGDQRVGVTGETRGYWAKLEQTRSVIVERGSRISQAHNHNIPLYDKRFSEYQYIVRLDDDVLLNQKAIGRMLMTMLATNAAAVGGLWFEKGWADEEYHDRAIMGWKPGEREETRGHVGEKNSNWNQRMYHPGQGLQSVEHLYSVCMYSAEKMRGVGGWPEVYSKGVAHGEETDGTYKLFLAGYDLYVDPTVTGQHLKSIGGIRDVENLGLIQAMDNGKWVDRLPRLEEVKANPTVAVWCQHAYSIGGAQRMFYQTVSLLQSKSGLDVYPIFTGAYYKPGECQEIFGFSYEERDSLEEYDICIVMGHQPFKPVVAEKYILHVFFPDDTVMNFEGFDLVLGISDYTVDWIAQRWGLVAHTNYPPVNWIGMDGSPRKDIILAVCRADPHKSPLWMLEKFIEFGFEGWEFHLVLASTDVFPKYKEQIVGFADEHENIVIHRDIDNEELQSLYRRARILWHAKGMSASSHPNEKEHFGLVPIEAWSAGCIPVVYDGGGHRETVDTRLRWLCPDELKKATLEAMGYEICIDSHGLQCIHDWYPTKVRSYPGNELDYLDELVNWIRKVQWMSVELQWAERIAVEPRKIRVAAVADSPHLTTGFGIVAKQIYKEFLKEKDMELFVFGIMDDKVLKKGEEKPYNFYPAPTDDLQGKKTLPKFIKWARPDVIWELYDPGNLFGHHSTVNKLLGQTFPWVAYFPVEGYPPTKEAYKVAQSIDYPVTYCKSASEALQGLIEDDCDIRYAYHGMDHADFNPLDQAYRDRMRHLVGWGDKFVISNVGTNKRVKQQPYLIEALAILLQRGHDDILLYLHTDDFNNHVMQGWDLRWVIDTLRVEYDVPLAEHVLFPFRAKSKWHGTPYKYSSDIDPFKMTMPPDPKSRGLLFHALDFTTRLGMADLYVDVSSAEGFGLPPLESAACGVPTVTVDDSMVRSEVHSKYCEMMTPRHWTRWHTGSRLSLLDPIDIADRIEELKGSPETMERLSSNHVQLKEDLKWEPTGKLFVDLVRRAYEETGNP